MKNSEPTNKSDSQQAKNNTDVFVAREADWRIGAVVYQVIVDRFAPSQYLENKLNLYPSPKQLNEWQQDPIHGQYLEDEKLWSHEIQFWGGDLASVTNKVEYLHCLGIDVLYLNPIHLAYTNHKYDALDYQQVSPEYGTRADVKTLADELHSKGMKLVLDGVFNHMGQNADIFKQALHNTDSEYRHWFSFSEEYEHGYLAWEQAANLPELNLENEHVREHVYGAPNSVVQSYLNNEGIDGWRLDVAFDIGPKYLSELTEAAQIAKSDALVVCEIWNYPNDWFPAIDAIMNFSLREIILRTVQGDASVNVARQMLLTLFDTAHYEHLLKSWIVLDNHDTPRLKTLLADNWQQQMAQVLQFTLPGAPNIYYGVEAGMKGGHDPEMRGPMQWQNAQPGNIEFDWLQQLITMRRQLRALRVGDFRLVIADQLLAFERFTDQVQDTTIVVINPTNNQLTESIMLTNSMLMQGSKVSDLLGTLAEPIEIFSGFLRLTVPAQSSVVLTLIEQPAFHYSPYKRVINPAS